MDRQINQLMSKPTNTHVETSTSHFFFVGVGGEECL